MPCYDKDFIALELVLYGKYDTSLSVTLWLTNQPALDDNTPEEYYPILKNVVGVGVEQDEFFPKLRGGSIRIDNSRDAIAFQRRLSDLAATFVIQGAPCKLYFLAAGVETESILGDLSLLWEGVIEGTQVFTRGRADSQNVALNIGREIPEWNITRKLRKSDFPDISDRSVGKTLPVVLGFNQQVIPYPVEEPVEQLGAGIKQKFVYATTLEGVAAPRFRNQGIQQILAPDLSAQSTQESKYYPVLSAVDVDTPVYEQIQLGPLTTTLTDMNTARAFWIPYFPGATLSPSYMVSGIRLFLTGNTNGGTPKGELSIRIHRQQTNAQRPEQPSKSITEAIVEKKDYPAWSGVGSFFVDAVFKEPVPIVGEGSYWISIQGSDESEPASETRLPIIPVNPGAPPGLTTHWSTSEDPATDEDNEDTWVEIDTIAAFTGQTTASFELYGVVIGDFPAGDGTYDLDGLGLSYCDIRYQDFAITHPKGSQKLVDLSRIDLILSINGLADTDGTVTGVPGFILGNPLTQIEALFHEFDGTSWQPGIFNDSRFSFSHSQYITVLDPFFRETAGRTYNQTTNIALIKELARNSYSTLVYDGIGGPAEYSLLAVGERRDATWVITDDDGLVERWFVNSLRNVVNVIDMNYARRLDNVHFQLELDQEEFKDYSKTLRRHHRDGSLGQQFSEKSFFHYGERRLEKEDFDFINSDKSAATVANLFIRLHDHPYEYAQVLVPYSKFQGIRMYDVAEIRSTELPSNFGTSPRVFQHDEDCRISGAIPAKTRPWLGEVVALTVDYRDDSPVMISVLLRLLFQENDPTLKNPPKVP